MDEALRKLVSDVSCPSSRLTVRISRSGHPPQDGVDRRHFQAVHALLDGATDWTSHSERWEEKVEYTAAPNGEDPVRDPVVIGYGDGDPLNVLCDRESAVGPPAVHMAAVPRGGGGAEHLLLRAARLRRQPAIPPELKKRYNAVRIMKFRDFTRRSSSVQDVSTTFRLTVMWRAHCLRDAYSAPPLYLMEVFLDRTTTGLGEGQAIPSAEAAAAADSLSRWMVANLKAKLGDVCLCRGEDLRECAAVPEAAARGATPAGGNAARKRRRIGDGDGGSGRGGGGGGGGGAGGGDEDGDLVHEGHEDEDAHECFDDDGGDEDFGDDYM